jgi:hypothetical protein
MTVNITFSNVSGGDSLSDTVDLGSVEPGNESSWQDIFIRHDAVVNEITDCAWYLQRYVGSSYLGENEDDDLTELMSWGDAATGGFIINQVIPPSWTYGEQFNTGDDQLIKNGYGDINNQLILDEDAINIGTPAGDGVIPVAGEAHIQARFKVPSSVPNGAGYRAATLVFSYSATS